MILMTGFYNDPDPRRRGELVECVKLNAANDHIDEVRVFIEDATQPDTLAVAHFSDESKVALIRLGRRLTFEFLFQYANENLSGRTVAIANADIFFDETLARLNGCDLTGKLLCLSRWNVQPDGSLQFFDHPASQDAWIFKSPLPPIKCDFPSGVPACDNRLAWEADRAGLKTINPARTIRVCHLHLSSVRRYSERQRLAGLTKAVPAEFLNPPRPAPHLPGATVAFRETMGYTVAQIAAGATSHNNEARPFKAIPESLAGLQYTQVVSMVVSPVQIEFLTPGKLYVLAGTDWYGYWPATTWLCEHGFKEDLPLVETERGTAFEVWSLAGEAGERFELPTQVMLASPGLVRSEQSAELDHASGDKRRDRKAVSHSPVRHLLIATRHNCGLWSMFFQVIGLIRFAERHGLEPVVYFNDATCWWSADGYNGSRNAWEYFFHPIGRVSAKELLGTSNGAFEHASLTQLQAALPNDTVRSDYILDHVGHYDHTEAQRREYASIVSRRIRIQNEVLAKLDPMLVETLSRGATAVHYRGTDKICESARQSFDAYYEAIEHRVDRSHKLFVATDEAWFLEWMIQTYGDRVVFTPAARSRDQTALHLGPQRGPRQAEECLLDVLLMAKCGHLVHGNSSVTNGVLAFNPTMTHDALHRRTEREGAV